PWGRRDSQKSASGTDRKSRVPAGRTPLGVARWASNLANINANGFRRAVLAMEERNSPDNAQLVGTKVSAKGIDFSEGPKQRTGRTLDVALSGDGFFSVQTPDGVRYTRAGSFFRDPNGGQLVNGDGYALVGAGGPITIDGQFGDSELAIDPSGTVSARGQVLGSIAVTAFADKQQLIPHGQVYFEAPPNLAEVPASAQVMQGHLEMSNAQPVNELISLILTSRMFEAAERTIRSIAETTQQNYRS
ncbi:MAG: flagellar hook-basal body protein, partial [Planctomycetota bacterium]